MSAATYYCLIGWIALTGILYTEAGMAGTICKLCGNNTVSLGDFNAEIINKAPEICIKCHPDRVGKPEHVIDVKVATPITEPLPLYNGKVTCVTCHDPFGTSRHLLRYDKQILCGACHGHRWSEVR